MYDTLVFAPVNWWMPKPAPAPPPELASSPFCETSIQPALPVRGCPGRADAKMATKRNTRPFVEEELVSEQREMQQPSTQATSNYLDIPLSSEREPIASLSNSHSSSRSSISSSSYTSSTSTPSDSNPDPAVSDLLNEDLAPDFNGERVVSIPPGAPINFGTVLPGLYRSSYPRPENYGFLRELGLKTIVTLVDKNFTHGYRDFMASNGIQHYMFGMKGTKKQEIPLATMEAILKLVLDRRNYPLLIHCNHGKHRTGCVVAVVRKIAGWDNASIVSEYRAYAGRKVRECDVDYINAFKLSSISQLLANEKLDIRDLSSSRGDGFSNSLFADPPATPDTTVGFRVANFFRATFFSMTVLFIWMISGSKMPPPNRR